MDKNRIIGWAGSLYSVTASVGLFVWLFSAFQQSGYVGLWLFRRPLALFAFLCLHFLLGLLAIQRNPKKICPIGPPTLAFRLSAEYPFYFSLAMLLVLLFPIAIRRSNLSTGVILPAILLPQTTYMFARFAAGYTILNQRRLQKEKIRAVLDAARSGDTPEACRRYGVSKEILERWKSEVESLGLANVLSRVEQAHKTIKRDTKA